MMVRTVGASMTKYSTVGGTEARVARLYHVSDGRQSDTQGRQGQAIGVLWGLQQLPGVGDAVRVRGT